MLRTLVFTLAVCGAGCGSDGPQHGGAASDAGVLNDSGHFEDTSVADTTVGETGEGGDAQDGPVDDGPLDVMDRPSKVFLPDNYDHGQRYPLVVLLHGYRVTPAVQDVYLGMSQRVNERGFILTTPSGTLNPENLRFWNAYWCCDFHGQQIDDVGYLSALVDEAKRRFNIDEQRVYFIGHSNGGFMSYRMACEVDGITAIVSIAGSGSNDPVACDVGAVSVLQVHGTADATILYDGAAGQYPSAAEMTRRWAEHNGCDPQPQQGEPLDITTVAGAETTTQTWSGCDDDTTVQLWAIDQGAHIPAFNDAFKDGILDFVLSKRAP